MSVCEFEFGPCGDVGEWRDDLNAVICQDHYEEIEANRCWYCEVSSPDHNPEDCADFAQWERELDIDIVL